MSLSIASKSLSLAMSQGRVDPKNSMIFAGPPTFTQVSDPDYAEGSLFPVGLASSVIYQDSRAPQVSEVIGQQNPITGSRSTGSNTGAISSFSVFREESDAALKVKVGNTDQCKTHLTKELYSHMRKYYASLVKKFYAGATSGRSSNFFKPIAFDDSDAWRNFSSPFYDMSFGLYVIEKSVLSVTLQANYFENCYLIGNMINGIRADQGSLSFDQVGFVYSEKIPVSPATAEEFLGDVGGSAQSANDIAEFLSEYRKYMGLE